MLRMILCILLLLFPSILYADTLVKLVSNDKIRTYLIHIPVSEPPAGGWPLVMNLHAGGSNAIEQQLLTGFNGLADANNFVVVYPNGTAQGLSHAYTWNAVMCCGYAVENQIDDISFLDLVIDDVTNRVFIDLSRVYETGYSNGSFMAYHHACHTTKLAAFAGVSGSQITQEAPLQPIPLLQIAGLLDPREPYQGGEGHPPVGEPYTVYSIPTVIGWWAGYDKATLVKTTKATEYTHTVYEPKNKFGATVELYTINSAGHVWDGSPVEKIIDPPGSKESTIIGPASNFPANQVIWDFFSQRHK